MMAGKPQAPKGSYCPLWRKDISKVCHTCEWYTMVRGQHPQTEQIIDQYGCAMAWAPTLLVNAAKEARQGAAATESFRNTMVGLAAASKRERIGQG